MSTNYSLITLIDNISRIRNKELIFELYTFYIFFFQYTNLKKKKIMVRAVRGARGRGRGRGSGRRNQDPDFREPRSASRPVEINENYVRQMGEHFAISRNISQYFVISSIAIVRTVRTVRMV